MNESALSNDKEWMARAGGIIRQHRFNGDEWTPWVVTWVYPPYLHVQVSADKDVKDMSKEMEDRIQPYIHRLDHHIDIKSTLKDDGHWPKRRYFFRITPIMGEFDSDDIELMNV